MKTIKKILFLIGIIFFVGSFAISSIKINETDTILETPFDSEIHLWASDKDPIKNETVATSTLLADFASQIIYGKAGQIESIMPGGVCPAHYEVSPSDYDLVDTADIIFSHGMEASFWLNDLLSGAGNTEAEVKIGPLVGGIAWGPPVNAIQYINNITVILNNTYNQPENQTKFAENAAAFITNIESNQTYLEGLAATYGFTGVKVVCMTHQRSFLEWLGFEIVATWDKSDEQMSVNDVNQLIGNATQGDAQLIISNLQSGTDVGAQVAAESNAIHVILCNFPGGVPNTPTYIDQIHYNVEQLKHGKDLYELYQDLLGDIASERDLFRILSYTFIGIAIVAILIAVFQQMRIKKLS